MKLKFSSDTFCTIITANYMHYALALYNSIQKYNKNIMLCVLISDVHLINLKLPVKENSVNINFFSIKDLCQEGVGKQIYEKYASTYMDGFRWSMKPVFINFLINKGFDKVIWADPDLFFVEDYDFIFKKLDKYNVLLTPHWRSTNPIIDTEHFDYLFIGGLYNAGFIAVNKKAYHVMEWWSKVCLHECVIDLKRGRYVDQTYLNLLPIYFDKVHILKHQGCNVSEWNQLECKRTLNKDGKVLINDKWPVVFIHFTKYTISAILDGTDVLLKPYLEEWVQEIKETKPDFQVSILPKKNKNLIYRVIRKIKLLKKVF